MKLEIDEVKEGGEIIAAYMGGTFHTDLPFTYIKEGWYDTPANNIMQVAQWHNFKYHSSWEWLMPVVDKINSLGKGYNVAIFKTYISLTVEKPVSFGRDYHYSQSKNITPEQDSKEAMFRLLVDFIKWDNSQK